MMGIPKPCFDVKTIFLVVDIPIRKIRQSWDYFMFWLPIQVRWHLYIEIVPYVYESSILKQVTGSYIIHDEQI